MKVLTPVCLIGAAFGYIAAEAFLAALRAGPIVGLSL